MKKYQVIGGQYRLHWYGESDSLHGARIIAGKNKEYWDNYQGWRKPLIYRSEDIEQIDQDGKIIRFPHDNAEPV